ncbi:ABC transporter permease [Dictyobacter aurantiacus]|uniref:Monosaccharide-transporting ATPase n=1 Tax=Dictyobacter aurantiacus TaxID=1936993 RepID=A0A401ZQU6_9CHLR|nr:ABC transporter permease [Dictyobacter aurantiacus]GCE09239.1 monosaccharide-transporting ATPase [Dictyobacter aurantiacus]
MATTPTPQAPASRLKGSRGLWHSRGRTGSLLACILLLLLNCIFTPNFLRFQTLGINLQQMSSTTIVAIGMTLVIATGGIDLSVGSVMAIAGVLAPLLFLHIANPVLGLALALFLPLLAGAACGLFNGWLVARIQLQPIIATLILFTAGRGIAQVLTNGAGQPFTNAGFSWLGKGSLLGLPVQAYLMALLLVVFSLFMRGTRFGRSIQAIGGNAEAARLAGVPVARTRIAVYVITGVLAALGGLIVVSLNSNSDPSTVGLNVELNAIAAVAIGGTSLLGGEARVFGTFLGALITQLIYTFLVGNNVPQATALVVNALIILVAVYLQIRPQS